MLKAKKSTTSQRSRRKEATKHLARAKIQWDEACTHSWEPAEPADCVSKCFYSYENALVAVAVALGYQWTKKHYEKAALAARLFKERHLKTDISGRLVELNELRKDVSYGEPGEELKKMSLEDLVSDLESFLDEVESMISS